MSEAEHDTRHIDMAVMDARAEKANQEVREKVYCEQCSTAVREEDYKYKYAGAGGVIVGPFCGYDCWSTWLFGGPEDSEAFDQ